MNLKNIWNKAVNGLLNDKFRQSFLVCVLSFLLSAITAVSTVTHLIKDTDKTFGIISAVTLIIALSVFFLTIFVKKYSDTWRRVFMAVLILFFGYLCYDGGPDGFLHIWILLIPAFSFITFGLVEGFVTAIPVFLAMIAFFWWPLAEFRKYAAEQASATPIYIDGQIAVFSINLRIRITLIYFVSMVLGYFAELVRRVAAKRLKEFTDHYEYVSMHDSLTGLANQNLLAKYLEDIYDNKDQYQNLGCLFVDVDAFKNVNDMYGHLFGNVVLIKIADILSEEKSAFVCRWGGDEYVICFKNIEEERLIRIGEKYRAIISACTFKEQPDFHITVSIGAVILPIDESFNFNHVLDLADKANRTAKKKGKDNVSLAEADNTQNQAK
ncbi:MAG: GGDEF domain-containing protein [Bacilli bacterium]|nr:GGDEF domain-containing protein [Bacilli bacterium]